MTGTGHRGRLDAADLLQVVLRPEAVVLGLGK
jgi:hypothetical protein